MFLRNSVLKPHPLLSPVCYKRLANDLTYESPKVIFERECGDCQREINSEDNREVNVR